MHALQTLVGRIKRSNTVSLVPNGFQLSSSSDGLGFLSNHYKVSFKQLFIFVSQMDSTCPQTLVFFIQYASTSNIFYQKIKNMNSNLFYHLPLKSTRINNIFFAQQKGRLCLFFSCLSALSLDTKCNIVNDLR